MTFHVQREKFLELFENVKDVRLISSGKKRFGYVEFIDEASAKSALAKDRTLIDGRPVFVSPYKPHEKGERAEFKFGTGLEKSKLFVKNVHYNASNEDLKVTVFSYDLIQFLEPIFSIWCRKRCTDCDAQDWSTKGSCLCGV